MLIKNGHIRNLVLQFPLEFIKAPSRKEWLLLYDRMKDADSAKMVLNEEGEVFVPDDEGE
jgi:hypothetical protein